MDSWSSWANDVFGEAQLGDCRRTTRLVWMAAQAGRHPSGRISEVFSDDAERQGAYDFVESRYVRADAIGRALTASTAQRCAQQPWVYVPVDSTSIKLWDGKGTKDFGAIGTYHSGATGLKLYSALALDPSGTPLGVAGLVWWCRPRINPRLRRPSYRRPVAEKETKYLLQCIEQVRQQMEQHAPGVRCWFQLDRGCDAQSVLRQLHDSGHWFTVRAHSDRRIAASGARRWFKKTLRQQPLLGIRAIELPAREGRPARRAKLAVRSAQLTLRLHDKRTKRSSPLQLNAVLVNEIGYKGPGKIEWYLLTNCAVATLQQAWRVVQGYTQRWRIEEYYKTWKTGACDVEDCQLHSTEHVQRWATILSAVAARIERLKYLARNKPDEPATVELSVDEVRALVLLHTRRKKRNEIVPHNPTIAQATLWIAQLGGYTGRSSGGPPGSITIARGLNELKPAVEMFRMLSPQSRMR